MNNTSGESFKKASGTYRQNAVVQKQMAKNLCALLKNGYGTNYNKILEIGAGTGLLTNEAVKNFGFNEYILNDMTDNFTGFDLPFIKGDATIVKLPDNCDLILSGACFQWIADIESFFVSLKSQLSPDGILCFSSFGEDNCKQFKSIFDIGLNYPDYGKILEHAGYCVLEYQKEINTLYFSSPKEVLRHIKLTGAILENNGKWSRERLKTFEEEYLKHFKCDMGVELTYNPLYVVARVR